jgi:hypothetical protein
MPKIYFTANAHKRIHSIRVFVALKTKEIKGICFIDIEKDVIYSSEGYEALKNTKY